MQTTIAFVLLFCLRTISLAADVTVYYRQDYDNEEPQKLEPVAMSQFPWKFGYIWRNESYIMDIFISNKSPSVTAINVTLQLDDRTIKVEKSTQECGQRKGEECYNVHFGGFSFTEIKIKFNLYASKTLCSSLQIAEGRNFSEITNEPLKKEFPHYDTCLNYGCVLVVDLINKCDGPHSVTESMMNTTTENAENAESSQNIVLYVILSVIGMCVMILVIYLIRVKKYCHRNSNPVQTIELNTYSTANEVVYADLGFVHGDSQPPRSNEESPYAQIIEVLKPVDGNVNNK